jgi:4-hydroxy-4-methyl-2-oxoglutarate aldolase
LAADRVKRNEERHVVVRSVRRTDEAVLEALAAAGVSTIHEAQGRTGYAGPDFRPIQTDARVAGNAVTVLCHPGDNIMIHAAVEVCEPGDILVVTNTGPSSHGMFGDLLATSLTVRGVRGLVIDAGVRDIAELRAMGFPVWSRYVSSQGTVKETPGSVNVPVTLGAVTVEPGDVVCADDDGVVVIPHLDTESVLEDAIARTAREAVKRRRLAAGELTMEIDGLRDKLVAMDVEFVESIDDTDPRQ